MKKQFNHVTDLNGKNKVYPVDKNFYTLFFTQDKKFFVYALYTKKDFSSPELIEIDFDSYLKIRDIDVIENFADNVDDLLKLLLQIKQEAVIDNLHVGEILNIVKKIDDK